MRKLKIILLCIATLATATVRADEGMWLLPLLQKYNIDTMRKMGFKLSADAIYSINNASLKDAIVIFGNGCTGEVVSQQGLLLTNHHCGYGAIQQHSTVEHDYLKDGFWANSLQEEIPTPGLTATFLIRMEDVTSQVTANVTPSMTDQERRQAIHHVRDSLANAATKDTHYKASVDSFYGGNQYFLIVYEVFTDIRMVGAPPSSIGKFGADTDNWMYPRHTGDFSIFRIYANKNNEPADYSPDNQPYKPKRSLTVSLAGYKEGDFAMIMGYPGRTSRYMTSWEIDQTIKVINTDRAHIRGIKQQAWKRHMDADQAIRIKYASKYASSANYWKNSIGQNEALLNLKVIEQKQQQERAFTQWVNESSERQNRFSEALPLIEQSVMALNTPMHHQMYYTEALFRGCEFNMLAGEFIFLEKAIDEKDTALLARYLRAAKNDLQENWFKDYDLATDRDATKAMLRLFKQEMPDSVLPDLYKTIDKKFSGNIDKYVDKLFDNSILVSLDRLQKFLEDPTLKKLDKDLGYQFARSTRTGLKNISTQIATARQNLWKGQRLYIAGQLDMLNGAPSYPDANFTMRLTYGSIKGYSPRDAVNYNYYTTTQGIMQKDNPNSWEFAVPEKLKKLHALSDFERYGLTNGTMPVNFLSTNDITGGNSGSPVLDADGYLIGLAFDGNWESLSGDIAFENEMQRCINVDIRYVLFIIDKYAGCTRLLDEMHIVK